MAEARFETKWSGFCTIILNIRKIKKVTTLVNGRILAQLNNGEKMIITRVYAQNFKQKLVE